MGGCVRIERVCECVRRAVRGVGLRTPGGAFLAAVGSSRRQSRGPGACYTPRPPPRSPTPLRPARRGSPGWSWAPKHSSSSTWCGGSGTTPEGRIPFVSRLYVLQHQTISWVQSLPRGTTNRKGDEGNEQAPQAELCC